MDVHFVDADDGKAIGLQIEFGEPEAIGTILAFAQFLTRSDDTKLASLATTVTVVATIMAQDASAGMLALEAPKAEPVDPPSPKSGKVDVYIAGKAWQVIERNSVPAAIESFRPEIAVSTGGSRAYFGKLDEDELSRLIAAVDTASHVPGLDKTDRGMIYNARRKLEEIAAETFGD